MTVAEQEYPYLLPQPDDLTKPYWDAAREHRLAIQACGSCGLLRHPPMRICADCGSEATTWQTMSGRGTLYSWITVHQTALPNWRGALPYNIVMVSLDDSPEIRLYGNVVDFDDARLKVGLSLEAAFDDVTSDDTIVRWRVVNSA